MLSSDIMRGYNDLIILSLLIEGPSYGYEISKKIKERSNENYVMKETTLYSAFARLEKNNYIQSFQQIKTAGRKRTYYEITETGRNYLNDKAEEWVVTQDVVNRFLMKGGS
ncbi:PadR family transcriptional regulator [Amphibacillus sp. Q70]|uniref:PadR family transcriptional regulator n=1 Tax=Amphibacillus sp. Q70 TaxID=3453416 RepID=UPI003F82B851